MAAMGEIRMIADRAPEIFGPIDHRRQRGGGGQAELAVVHERQLMAGPESLEIDAAGGVPECFTTAHDALFTQCALEAGERLLVHGGAGGVGTAAIQLGVCAGARVFATVRDPALREGGAGLGASVLAPEEFTQRGPFDVILELVGGPNLGGDVEALAMGGKHQAVYLPDPVSADVYDRLYAEYLLLHDYFGRGGNEVMHRLRGIRDRVVDAETKGNS